MEVMDDDKGAIPKISHRLMSMIDESHRKAVVAIDFLPSKLEIERRGKANDRGYSERGIQCLATRIF